MRAIPGRNDPTASPKVLAETSRPVPEIGYNACTPDFRSMFLAPESDRPPDFGPRFAVGLLSRGSQRPYADAIVRENPTALLD